jgi:hypothetical protein
MKIGLRIFAFCALLIFLTYHITAETLPYNVQAALMVKILEQDNNCIKRVTLQ